jgi:FeS assembly SUF system regulator
MLKMSRLTDYGTGVLAWLAGAGDSPHSASEVAERTGLPTATVSKVLKLLTRAGLVVSQRGAQGGYLLARPAAEITAAQVIDALEGPVALTECSHAGGSCDLEAQCLVGNAWQRINVAIRRDPVDLGEEGRTRSSCSTGGSRPMRTGRRCRSRLGARALPAGSIFRRCPITRRRRARKDGPKSLDEVDPKLLETYEKLGIPLHERSAMLAGVAVDAVFDSVSVATTFKDKLAEAGVIFCSFSEAVRTSGAGEAIWAAWSPPTTSMRR